LKNLNIVLQDNHGYMSIRATKIASFRKKIFNFYSLQQRDLPWRHTRDPFKIFVSEIMLQQTQVERVLYKYKFFLKRFPDIKILAQASLADVLKTWQGLGYNRRAKYLLDTAHIIYHNKSEWPKSHTGLMSLPGIGQSTAGAILAFAYKQPVVFIETNIRRVFIHEFFKQQKLITDTEILGLIRQTLPDHNIDIWYWSLMDYGSKLKKQKSNPNQRSTTYHRQSSFKNSQRFVRGKIISFLNIHQKGKEEHFSKLLNSEAQKNLPVALKNLEKENLIIKKNKYYFIK